MKTDKGLFRCMECGALVIFEQGSPLMCSEPAMGGVCGGKMLQVWPAPKEGYHDVDEFYREDEEVADED